MGGEHGRPGLAPGTIAIVGYGSLLARRSMERTLGRPYEGAPVPCALQGWRRSWDAAMPNPGFHAVEEGGDFTPDHILYLDIRPAAGDAANGLLYVLTPDDLAAFDRREWIYDRVRVTDAVRGVAVDGADVYAYVAKPEWRAPPGGSRRWGAVRRSYVAIVEQGLAELGPAFRAEYERSSDPTPTHLLFDDQPPTNAAPAPR